VTDAVPGAVLSIVNVFTVAWVLVPPLSLTLERALYEPSAGAAKGYVHVMLPLLVQGDGQVTELKTSEALLKLVPFQYRLSLFLLMLTEIVRLELPLLKLTFPPMSPPGVPLPAL
jgi:hypothetical protein